MLFYVPTTKDSKLKLYNQSYRMDFAEVQLASSITDLISIGNYVIVAEELICYIFDFDSQ